MRIVVSFGHGALDAGVGVLARTDRFLGVQVAARGLHALLDAGHEVVATHAHEHAVPDMRVQNGSPDIRDLATQEARADGLAGYFLEQSLRNLCTVKRSFATVVTHTLVDERDPAFAKPTRLVGPFVTEVEAQRLERRLHWNMRVDEVDSDRWCRVVPAPEPITVLQSEAIRTLVTRGHTVLCSGGGIAVTRDVQNHEHGIEALVYSDLGAGVIAREIEADALLFVTDVSGVYADWSTAGRQLVRRLSAATFEPEHFEAHTMRPKLEAASRFARRGGLAVIGSLGDLPELLDGRAGTIVEA